jgi:RecQ mediated genome instability protein
VIDIASFHAFSLIGTRDAMTLQTQVLAHFASKQIHLSNAFISALLNSVHPPPTTINPALLASFHTSFLNSSLLQSTAAQSHLPLSLPSEHNISLPGPTLVQVIHVQDIGSSRLAQLEALEKAITEAGPQGRRVVNLPADEEGYDDPTQNGTNEGLSAGKSICKVLLEDGRGERVYGMEAKPIEGIKVGMPLGCKVFSCNRTG